MATSEGERVEAADEEVREFYARYGLAMYFAQVVEHAIVNWAARPRRRDPGGASLCTLSRFHRGRARAGAWRNGSGGRRRWQETAQRASWTRPRSRTRLGAACRTSWPRGRSRACRCSRCRKGNAFRGHAAVRASGVRLRRNKRAGGGDDHRSGARACRGQRRPRSRLGTAGAAGCPHRGSVAQPWRGPAAQPGVARSSACPAARQALTHRNASGRAPRRPARRTCHGQASGHG